MHKVSVNISDDLYSIFEEVSDDKDVNIEKVIENYFCLNVDVPEFRIAKCDYKLITILKSIVIEFKQVKNFLNKSKIKEKEKQYKIINSIVLSAEGLLEAILGKLQNGTGLKLNEKDKITNESYTNIINEIHKLCLNDRTNMVKFLRLMVNHFDDIKSINLG